MVCIARSNPLGPQALWGRGGVVCIARSNPLGPRALWERGGGGLHRPFQSTGPPGAVGGGVVCIARSNPLGPRALWGRGEGMVCIARSNPLGPRALWGRRAHKRRGLSHSPRRALWPAHEALSGGGMSQTSTPTTAAPPSVMINSAPPPPQNHNKQRFPHGPSFFDSDSQTPSHAPSTGACSHPQTPSRSITPPPRQRRAVTRGCVKW